MLNDFLRSVDENYFVHEIYPGLGMFRWYDTPFDMRFKLYGALSSGAKGMLYWQYRAERLGHENDCAGIMRMDGSPREVAFEVKNFGENLHKDMEYFVGAKAKKADVAIVFDFNSMLMSEIEDSCGADYDFGWGDAKFYYRNAHAGMYRMLHNADYAVEYISATQPEKFKDYKVLYFPYYAMLDKAIMPYLEAFVKAGGVVIADEGFGMRAPNTWMQVYDIDCKPLMTARLRERRVAPNEYLEVNGETLKIAPYTSEYAVENAETLLSFKNGKPALQKVAYGKGKVYLFGFSIGYSYYMSGGKAWLDFMDGVMKEVGVRKYEYASALAGVYEKRLEKEEEEGVFLFNASAEEKAFKLRRKPLSHGGDGRLTDGNYLLPANSMGYVIWKK